MTKNECPTCGRHGDEHSTGHRVVVSIDGPLVSLFRTFRCAKCKKFFRSDRDVTRRGGKYTLEVVSVARKTIAFYKRQGSKYFLADTREHLIDLYGLEIPNSTLGYWGAEEE